MSDTRWYNQRMNSKSLSPVDRLIDGIDQTLRRMHRVERDVAPRQSLRLSDAHTHLDETQRQLSARLMRVNHAGEVAAQALYHGQALASTDVQVQESMERAAAEEAEHLDWCATRLDELNAHTSVLNPLWYAGSFAIGYAAGLAGDRWSLGFIGETERQVVEHLDRHMQRLPPADVRSRAILQAMQEDEARHGEMAMAAGGQVLPGFIKRLMQLTSKVMTRTAFWL